MANENKNQDEINANDLKDGDDSGNFRSKASGSENFGKKGENKLCDYFISFVISFFLLKKILGNLLSRRRRILFHSSTS